MVELQRSRIGDLERLVTVVLVLAIAAIAVVVVRREVVKARIADQVAQSPPTYVEGWEQLAAAGTILGSGSAPIKIVEVGDLQCPACRGYQRILETATEKFGGRVAVVFVHYPLPYHEHGFEASRGPECAARQGKAAAFVSTVYSKQDSLGALAMDEFAGRAGVGDLAAFKECMARDEVDAKIRASLALAEKFDIEGTPTILINGWQYDGSPREDALATAIKRLLAGKSPAGEVAPEVEWSAP